MIDETERGERHDLVADGSRGRGESPCEPEEDAVGGGLG